jgi:DNA polymerase I-like protein with 3'-5' exonuclease and polymerase domains
MREWWYNSLDAAVTLEIHHTLSAKNAGQTVYAFERALQGPALDMMLNGFKIDRNWQAKSIKMLEVELTQIEERLDRLAHAIWDQSLNPRSPTQLTEFFFRTMRIPEIWTSKKGVRKLSTDRDALEKISAYFHAAPIVSLILAARNASKALGVLRTGVDPDGRMRCSYNVCGTETGRWSSSSNVYGRGTNLQNITEKLRRMFVADDGYVILYVDGEQAESRSVGFIHGTRLGDWRYLDACESGDLHTLVTKMVWPNLPWTGDPKLDREIADQGFYRWFSYRDMAKRGGHGTSYYGQPPTMARHLKVPVKLIEDFQRPFKAAFGFPAWWKDVAHTLNTTQSLTTFLGRERTFFGRPNDDATLRKAIAYEPQSTVGDIVNEGGYRVWRKFCLDPARNVTILGQIHDAFLFQVRETHLHLIPEILTTFTVPVTAQSRTLTIPAEAKVGWNWASNETSKPVEKRTYPDGNPDGLSKWKGSLDRKRTENPSASLLDRILY